MKDVLQQVTKAIEGVVRPLHRDNVDAIALRAKKILYHEKTHNEIFTDITRMDLDSDPQKLALAVAGVITLMRRETDKFEDECIVPACSIILADVLDFMSESAGELTAEFIGNAYEELLAMLMQKIGVGPEEIEAMLEAEHTIRPFDPAKAPPPQQPQQPQQPQGVINQAAVAQ